VFFAISKLTYFLLIYIILLHFFIKEFCSLSHRTAFALPFL